MSLNSEHETNQTEAQKARQTPESETQKDKFNKSQKDLQNFADNLPYMDQLFLIWIGSLQSQCKTPSVSSNVLCQKLAELLPDMTSLALYLYGTHKSIDVKDSPEDFTRHYEILKRTRMYRLFVVSVGSLLAAGLGVKYAIRKWTEYMEKRKGTPEQRKLENQVVKQPSDAKKLLKVKKSAAPKSTAQKSKRKR